MRLLDRPVRPKPDYFGPDGAPPGITLRLDAYETLNDGTKWLASRPTITPNTLVAHTNGASVEATTESSVNHGLRGRNNTKPHYCLGDVPTKTLATDKRGIANSTGSSIEAEYGVRDSSFWSIAVETADLGSIEANGQGYDWPHDCGPFLYDNADDLAHIIAYESMVPGHEFPIRIPPSFPAGGVVAHTWPWPYPHFTTVPGKTCPGTTKIAVIRYQIIPRAQQIRALWSATEPPTPEPDHGDSDMDTLPQRRIVDTRGVGANFDTYKCRPNTQHDIRIPEAKGYKAAQVTVTVVNADNGGHITVWKTGERPDTSMLNYERDGAPVTETLFVELDANGTFQLWTYAGIHLVVDFTGLLAR